MDLLEQITVDDFKAQFPRFTPMYLPEYDTEKTYFKGDIVYYNNAFYQCIVDSSTDIPTDTNSWTPYQDDVLNYTRDEDIQNAMIEAITNFNETLWDNDTTLKMVFLYLTAHYLTIDFRNAIGSNEVGIKTSKSVGSVSEGYTIPKYIQDNPILSMYANTGYGLKYATLLYPNLIGNCFIVGGATTV